MARVVQRLFAADAHAPHAIEVVSSTAAPVATSSAAAADVGVVRVGGRAGGKAESVTTKVCVACVLVVCWLYVWLCISSGVDAAAADAACACVDSVIRLLPRPMLLLLLLLLLLQTSLQPPVEQRRPKWWGCTRV